MNEKWSRKVFRVSPDRYSANEIVQLHPLNAKAKVVCINCKRINDSQLFTYL